MGTAGKNVCNAGINSGLLRGDTSEPNRRYVLAQCLELEKFRMSIFKMNFWQQAPHPVTIQLMANVLNLLARILVQMTTGLWLTTQKF